MAPGNTAVTAYQKVFFPLCVAGKVHWEFKPIFLDLGAPEVFAFATEWLC